LSDLVEQLHTFLAEHRVLSLATLGAEGQPQAADVYYACPAGLALYFVSAADSRHAANLARDPRVAGTVHADASTWRDIRGVQLEGTCRRLRGRQRAAGWAHYVARFPFVLADITLLGALQEMDVYCIMPDWLRWIDNSVALGHHLEYRP
jgi:hypothetical protein